MRAAEKGEVPGAAATEVYKVILKETGDAMSARVREVFQRP